MNRWFGLLLPAALACCGSTDQVTRGAADRGEALFASTKISRNGANALACSTCHTTSSLDPRRLAGATLAGVTLRPSFWGGRQRDLLASTNDCLKFFMLDATGLAASDPNAKDLYAYLESLPPEVTTAVPFTVVGDLLDLPGGDAARGQAPYTALCASCHGAIKTGDGRIAGAARLPDDTRTEHLAEGPEGLRKIVVEKVRHGAFLGYSGRMPPFSAEVMTDQELADVIAYLGF